MRVDVPRHADGAERPAAGAVAQDRAAAARLRAAVAAPAHARAVGGGGLRAAAGDRRAGDEVRDERGPAAARRVAVLVAERPRHAAVGHGRRAGRERDDDRHRVRVGDDRRPGPVAAAGHADARGRGGELRQPGAAVRRRRLLGRAGRDDPAARRPDHRLPPRRLHDLRARRAAPSTRCRSRSCWTAAGPSLAAFGNWSHPDWIVLPTGDPR